MMLIFLVLISLLQKSGLAKSALGFRDDEAGFRQTVKNCTEKLSFTNCKNGIKSIYRNQDLRVIGRFVWCEKKAYVYNFNLIHLETGTEKQIYENPGPILYLKKFSLNLGKYRVELNIFSADAELSLRVNNCILEVKGAPLVPKIRGGLRRYVETGSDLFFDGSSSIDYANEEKSDVTNFRYEWSYTCDRCDSNTNLKHTGPIFALPNNISDVYTMKMGITSKWWNNTVYALQRVVVRTFALNFYIDCESEKCETPFQNAEYIAFKGVCKDVECPKTKWLWRVYRVPFDDDLKVLNSELSSFKIVVKETSYLDDFRIKHEVTTPDTTYVVVLSEDKKSKNKAMYKFKTWRKYDFACSIIPSEGYVRKTKFHFECDGTGFGSFFLVILFGNGAQEMRAIQTDSSWEYLEFIVPKHMTVMLLYTHYSTASGFIAFDPDEPKNHFKLLETELNQKEIDEILREEDDSVKNMIINHDYGDALNKLSLLSIIIEDINEEKFKVIEPTMNEIISYIEEILSDNFVIIHKTSLIMADFTKPDISINSNLIKRMSNLCRNVAERNKNLIESDSSFSTTHDGAFGSIIRKLMECSMIGTRSNEMAIKPENSAVEVSTVEYMLDDTEFNTEHYPEYLDDTEALINKDRYKNITKNYIAMCNINGETLMMQKQDNFEVVSAKYMIAVLKERGTSILRFHNDDFKVEVMFSNDITTSFQKFEVKMCITVRSMFWWDNSVPLGSNVLTLSITEVSEASETLEASKASEASEASKASGARKYFKDPFKIRFQLIDTTMKDIYPPTANVIQPICSTDRNSASLRISKPNCLSGGFSEGLPTHIIAVRAGAVLVVEFLDLEKNFFHVTSSYSEIPTILHLREKFDKIWQRKPHFVDNKIFPEHNFRLIAVKPLTSKKNEENPPIKYKLKAYTVSCVKFDETTTVWNYTCKALYDIETKKVTCLCETLSTLTASMKQIPIKNWQNHLELKIHLEETYWPNVNIFIATLFLMYCLLACLGIRETDASSKAIYFLSDVVYRSRFGYLIILKTGGKLSASTTSNVVIKLRGSKAASEPHVLNYPDPGMKLLQNNSEDWFFLATDHHLGILIEIELWSDGAGFMPDWKCEEMKVFDFQKNKWYYKTEACTLSIYPKPKVYAKFSLRDHHASYHKRTCISVLRSLLRYLRPPHRLFNFSLRRTNESFSYFKRLSLMMSMISSIAILCMRIYGLPHKDPTDSIMLFCEFQITKELFLNGIYASLGASLGHVPIMYLFMRSKVQMSYELKGSKKKRFVLTLLCWVIVVPIIVFNLSFLVLNGVWYPDVTSQVWMASVGFGILFYIFVIETICYDMEKLFEVNKDAERYVKRKYHIILKNIELQRKTLYIVFGKFLLRPFLLHLYEPLRDSDLKVRWLKEKMKFSMRETVENLVTFVTYISLVYVIIVMKKDYRFVYNNQQVKNLMNGLTSEAFPLEDVVSLKTLEQYIEETLIHVTQSNIWYDKYAIRNPGMSIDYNNKMLGVVRIRQFRAEARSCDVLKVMSFLKRSCHSNYFDSQSYRNFGIKWDEDLPPPSEDRMKYAWTFASSKTAGTSPTLGKLGYYSGGGYVAFLGRGIKNALINLEYLKKYTWFDHLTRGIFIEFLLYNVNMNVFNAVTLMIERSPSGYLKNEVEVTTSRMLLVSKGNITLVSVLLLCFVILVTAFSIRTFVRIRRTGVWYFRDLWHIIDFLLVFLSVLCIFMFYYKGKIVGDFLKSLEGADPKEFVNYSTLLDIDHSYTVISSILIMIGTIKLWGLFRFFKIFKVVERTLIGCIFPLCAISAYHFVTLIAFTLCGHVLFVDTSYNFEGITNTFESLMLIILQPLEEEELKMLDEPLFGFGYVFYVAYVLTTILFTCIHTAVIILFYQKAMEDLSNAKEVYSVPDYVSDQFKFLVDFLKARLKPIRLRGGQEENDHDDDIDLVEPKSDNFLYADSLTLNAVKLRTMSLVALCALKKVGEEKRPLSQHDIRLMTYTLHYLKKMQKPSDEAEGPDKRFYKVRLGNNKMRLMTERNLTRTKIAVSLLLGESKHDIIRKLHLNEDEVTMDENSRLMKAMNAKLKNLLKVVRNFIITERENRREK